MLETTRRFIGGIEDSGHDYGRNTFLTTPDPQGSAFSVERPGTCNLCENFPRHPAMVLFVASLSTRPPKPNVLGP